MSPEVQFQTQQQHVEQQHQPQQRIMAAAAREQKQHLQAVAKAAHLQSGQHSSTSSDNSFKSWAEGAAKQLKTAVEQGHRTAAAVGSPAPSTPGSNAESAEVDAVTKHICRQLAKAISDDIYSDIVGALRTKLRVVEDACLAAVWDAQGSAQSVLTAESPVSDGQASTNEDTIAVSMDGVLHKVVPQETSKYLAKHICAQLLLDDPLGGVKGSPSSVGSGTDVVGAATGFPIAPDHEAFREDLEPAVDATGAMTSARAAPAGTAGGGGRGEAGSERVHRKFYQDNRDTALQLDAFKKFQLVLVTGRGFRVIKHNHNGGRKSRILKYNPAKNRLFWESSRFIGAEHVDCGLILRVNREENVVYVWHSTGSRAGGAKKMVGFETQREYDARVLELALLYLLNNGPAGVSAADAQS